MEYKEKNGLMVCEEGFVIIEGIEHYIKSGYVCCDPSLNQRSWGTTEKKYSCEKCAKFIKPFTQLSLF